MAMKYMTIVTIMVVLTNLSLQKVVLCTNMKFHL